MAGTRSSICFIMQGRFREGQGYREIPRLRFAALGMTKGRMREWLREDQDYREIPPDLRTRLRLGRRLRFEPLGMTRGRTRGEATPRLGVGIRVRIGIH